MEHVDLGPFRCVQYYPRRVQVEPGWVPIAAGVAVLEAAAAW